MANQQSLNELALFAGAGGGILGGHLLGWQTVCAVEWGTYPASVLCARQNDGLLPTFPIWDDVQTFDGKPWQGIVDVVSGGFPCQDISAAGKGAGLEGARSGMWHHMARVVGEVRPRFVFVENSPMLTSRGGTRVIGDLAKMGYDCKWTVMGAADVGANHNRDRIWIVATLQVADTNLQSTFAKQERQYQWPKKPDGDSAGEMGTFDAEAKMANTSQLFSNGSNDNSRISMERETQPESGNRSWEKNVGESKCSGLEGQWSQSRKQEITQFWDSGPLADIRHIRNKSWWEAEPNVGRVADGVAARVDRLKAIGNGQVPLCAATAWRLLTA